MNRFARTRSAGQTAAPTTVLATTVAPGSTVSSNAQGQLVDAAGNVIVDATGAALTSISQLVAATGGQAAPAATASATLVAIPLFGADGNALIGADGKPATQMVPTGSAAAKALSKGGWMRGGWGMLWMALGIAAVTYVGSYWGARVAMRKARAKLGSVKRSRRTSRRVSVVS